MICLDGSALKAPKLFVREVQPYNGPIKESGVARVSCRALLALTHPSVLPSNYPYKLSRREVI